MLTIKDIAKKAGVSTATVSRVLNNYPDVSLKTREKIIKIIKELNYTPSAVARSLSTNKSYTVGIFFTDHFNTGLQHPFFREVIFGMEKEFGENGYDMVYFTNRRWGDSFSYTEKCKNRHVDGVILIGVPKTDPNLNKLLDSEIPTVFIDLDVIGKNASYVISDNAMGARQAVEYLYNLGHRKIGMITGLNITIPTQERLKGFLQAVNKLQLPYNPQWIVNGQYNEEAGYAAMQQIIEMEDRPTAIFCHSDIMAIGAIKAIYDSGMEVPKDFSVIGFDNIEISGYFKPGLTTIHQDKPGMGKEAAKLLLKIINNSGQSHAPVILPTKLMERETCSAPKIS